MTSRFRAVALAAAGLVALAGAAFAATGPGAAQRIEVWASATCACCVRWVEHMVAAGFDVTVHEVADMAPVKAANGVPGPLESCHTALVDGYVVEGHVPADDVKRLLAERPAARGLSAPGMPQDAPGMDMGTGEPYRVVLFGGPDGAARLYATH